MKTKSSNTNHILRAGSMMISLIVMSMLLVVPFTPASAAPVAAPAADGEGTMSVSLPTVTYGTVNTYVFTFTANIGDFGPGSQVALIIPNGWTAPTSAAGAGHVSVASGTCTLSGAPPFGIAGSTIFIDMASCASGQSFTVTYAGVIAPAVAGSPYTFLTQTDIGSGGAGLVNITAGSPTVIVNPATLTVSAAGLTPANRIYDGTTASTLTIGSPALVGVVAGDSVSLVTAGAIGTFADRNVGSSKTVQISGLTISGADSGNYNLTQPTRTANITKRSITVTAVSDTRIYNGTTSSSGIPVLSVGTPLAVGDTEPLWAQTFNNKNAGTGKILTPAGLVIDGNGGQNYAYTYAANSTGVISKSPITVTAVTDTKFYNGTVGSSGNPNVLPSLVGTDTPNFSQTFDNKNVGANKTLTPSGTVNDGNSGLNYSYAFVTDTTGVIQPKPLTVSAAGLIPANKIYDGTTAATLTIGNPVLVGVVAGDSVTLVTGGAVGTFIDKNAGTGKVVQISGLTLSGSSVGNYTLIQPTRAANITKRPITVTAVTDNKGYDGTVSSLGVPILSAGTPLAVGDTAPIWTQTFNNENAGTGKTLTPAGLVSDGNGGQNYSYTYAVNATGVITKKAITVTAVTDTRMYDGSTGSTALPVLSVGTPLAPGDTEPVWTQTFNTRNVGAGKTLTPAGAVNDGNSGQNYAYSFVPDITGVITQKPITVTAVTDTKVYDGTANSSVTPNISPNLVGTDTSGFTQSFNDKNFGTGKTLTPAGTVNDGNSGLNYSYAFVPVSSGVITAKPITITADAKTKSLGAGDPPLTYSVVPVLFAGDLFSGALTRDAGETYGTYAITQGGLTAGGNYTITFIGANLIIGLSISGNSGVGGATLSYFDDGGTRTVVSASDGAYALIVTNGWSGTVTPFLSGYVFTPPAIAYSNVTTDQIGQNYIAKIELLQNSGFETYVDPSKIPQFWAASGFSINDGKDTVVKYDGLASVRMIGAPRKTHLLSQTFMLGGLAGDSFTLSFWAQGLSIPSAGICRAQVLVYNGTRLKSTQTVNCLTGTYGFQKFSLSFAAPSVYTKLIVKFTYSKSSGTIWFDAASLTR